MSTRLTTFELSLRYSKRVLLSLFGGFFLAGCVESVETTEPVAVILPDCNYLATWTAPTGRENGNTFLPEHIQKFTLNYFNEETNVNTDVGPTIRGWQFFDLSGHLSFRVNVTDTDGLVSDWSNTKIKTFADAC